MKISKLALALAMGLSAPAADGAEATSRLPTSQLPTSQLVVASDDLDLSRSADARRLKARIQIAIRKICAQPGNSALAAHSERLCRRSATIDMGPPYPRM